MFVDLITLLLAAMPFLPADVHTARDVRLLPLNNAQAKLRVSLRGTVTFVSPRNDYFYLQDDTGGVRVKWATKHEPQPGEWVQVIGNTTLGDFLPEVEAKFITADTEAIGKHKTPVPIDYTLTMDDAAYLDGQLVEAVVVVQRAWTHDGWLQFDVARGRGSAVVCVPLPGRVKEGQALAGAVMKIRGVCHASVHPNRQLAGPPRILVNDLSAFEMVRPPRAELFAMPPVTARDLAVFRPDPIEARLPVHVTGVVTLNLAGRQLHIHDGTGVFQAILMDTVTVNLGDRVSVVGYPRPSTDPQRLDNSQVHILGPGEFPSPQLGSPAQARDGKLEGQVMKFTGVIHEVSRQKEWQTITIVAEGLSFTALLLEPPTNSEPDPAWLPGCKIEVAGIVTKQPLDGIRRNSFAVFTNKDAIQVLETPVETRPSWWTGRRVAFLTAGFLGLFLLSGATVTVLRIQVRRAAAIVRKQYEEKEKLEGQLKLAAKLETVGRLAGGIAHDFNNLLTVINGCAVLLEEEIAKNPAKAKGHAAEIQRAGGQAAALTRQLLTFSRQRAVTPHPIDLNAVVMEAVQVLMRLMGDKVTIRVATEPNLPFAMAESSLLAQILLNLAVNARDAMPNGGILTLATTFVQPGLVRLSASDTGVGMTDEVKAHIFEPFFTTKEVGRGTGLGLSTVYGIVQTLGGKIRFRSEQGSGTTFEVDLPATGATDALAPRGPLTPLRLPIPPDPSQMSTDLGSADDTIVTPSPLSPLSKTPVNLERSATVFLVEDDDAVRMLVTHVLEQAGLKVLTATGSEDARRVLASYTGPVDLLITDVVMPGQSGRELAEQLRNSRPNLRVLFISGYTSDEILLQGVREDQVELLHKPFAPRELVEQVRRILGQPA
jgi:signal transduction histidine kinase